MNIKELAKMIDHTNLNSNASKSDKSKLCEEAIKYRFCSVVVSPYYVSYANNYNNSIKVCTIIGFPLGYNTIETKLNEAKLAINNGASELDMVVNVSAIKNSDWNYVYTEIKSIVDLAKNISKGIVIKVIIETDLLNNSKKVEVSKLCKKASADFVKTSTGFGGISGATVEDIELIKNNINITNTKIKASGEIRDLKTTINMINA